MEWAEDLIEVGFPSHSRNNLAAAPWRKRPCSEKQAQEVQRRWQRLLRAVAAAAAEQGGDGQAQSAGSPQTAARAAAAAQAAGDAIADDAIGTLAVGQLSRGSASSLIDVLKLAEAYQRGLFAFPRMVWDAAA